jgi:signal transduction histidine kinase
MAWLMKFEKNKRRAMLSWVVVCALFVLCGALGVLQYRWIGEVSLAERERLQKSLQASLSRLSRDFNYEITAACRALLPVNPQPEVEALEAAIVARYDQWKKGPRHTQAFRRVAIAVPHEETIELRNLDLDRAVFETVDWPAEWKTTRERLEFGLSRNRWQGWSPGGSPPGPGRNSPGPPPGLGRMPPGSPPEGGRTSANSPAGPGRFPTSEGFVFEVPLFAMPRFGTPPLPFGRRETKWLIYDLNPQYLRDVLLPEMIQRHLGDGGNVEYQAEVVTRTRPPTVIYHSGAARIDTTADASVGLFELQYDQIFRRMGTAGRDGRDGRDGRERGPGPGRGPVMARGPGPDSGRWQMFVRHRAGSLEAVVSQARWRNLAVTAGVLLLMLASVAALIRFTRRAQNLAAQQMSFVAGVSHELRTPLTVIHTAAYNLQGRLAKDPSQVERYGALIQQESGRLRDLVEQVLRFASIKAGQVIREPQPLSVESVIDDTMQSSKAVLEGSRCVVEKTIQPGLPRILGDSMALKHALQNLISNAAKYGTEGGRWIGVFASTAGNGEQPAIEIRVADRGPGIPVEEQRHVFDAFFRGKRALQDQIHGTGLGLSLVKEIIEAHGGTIAVHSEPAKGTVFVVHIPAATPEQEDEFAHSLSGG